MRGWPPTRRAPAATKATSPTGWNLAVVPQGGIVGRARSPGDGPGARSTTSSSCARFTAVFAGQVALGPVEIDVTVLRRGRTMSQLSATVRNPGREGRPHRGRGLRRRAGGLRVHRPRDARCPRSRRVPSFRDGLPPEAPEEFRRDPLPFWEQVVEGKPGIGHPPWEDYEPVTSERATWQRLDDPPLLARRPARSGRLPRPLRHDAGRGRGEARAGAGPGVVRPERRPHGAPVQARGPGWLLAHNKARWAGDGYASVDMALWDPTDRSLVAYATQMMFFTFPEGW